MPGLRASVLLDVTTGHNRRRLCGLEGLQAHGFPNRGLWRYKATPTVAYCARHKFQSEKICNLCVEAFAPEKWDDHFADESLRTITRGGYCAQPCSGSNATYRVTVGRLLENYYVAAHALERLNTSSRTHARQHPNPNLQALTEEEEEAPAAFFCTVACRGAISARVKKNSCGEWAPRRITSSSFSTTHARD